MEERSLVILGISSGCEKKVVCRVLKRDYLLVDVAYANRR